MKKYSFLLLIPVLIYFFWDKQESKTASILTTRPIPQKVSKHKQQIFGKRPKLKPVAAEANTVCDTFRDSLDDMDFMQEIDQWLTLKDVELLPGCLPLEFHTKITEIKNNCFEKVNKELCLTNMVMLRGILRAKLIRHAETRSDLADVMMSEFAKPVPDFKKLKKLSRTLLQQNPNDLPVQKVWALSSMASVGDPAKLADSDIEEIYSVLDKNLIENDPEFTGLDTILKTKLQPLSVEEHARQKLVSDPQDFKTQEMLGWSLWQQGRREEAIAQVDAILARNPDPWLKEMRNKLTQPGASKESYQGRINIGIRLEDLWE